MRFSRQKKLPERIISRLIRLRKIDFHLNAMAPTTRLGKLTLIQFYKHKTLLAEKYNFLPLHVSAITSQMT